ncbi:BON domain-containing protein [Paractinoplanes rishiriensis]|uniref:BON domain-containing protein n=1 Tax=Paractinoplanes rishiriensis TaxID=1050105 RepID=A0A919K7T0_9ACTN|nr:BON domain-containing protein [Actinoplanes rishiriensis]GIF01250.1 hypothetical protein Ari01nite_87140 [Actinoplanes rishiriensis]
MQPLPDDEFITAQRRRDPVVATPELQFALSVVLELIADERTRCEPIRVSVQNDVVVLTGVLRSWAAVDAAADLVRSLPGERDLCNALRGPGKRKDGHSADDFEQIVGRLLNVSPPPVRSRRPYPRWLVLVMLVLLWLVAPVSAVLVGLPAVPLALTAVAVSADVLESRRL